MKLYNINKDLVIYLNCLYTIMNYENYREEFKQLLNMKPIQYMLAWAMKNDDEGKQCFFFFISKLNVN